MEAGGCTEPAEENMGPDAFYVEEAQATLAHIQELGLPELAQRLISSNPGPQVTIPESCIRKKSDFVNFTKTKELKKIEVTSILKRRYSEQLTGTNSTIFSLVDEVHSEDSSSQLSDDVRKVEKKKYDSNEEDSEGDEYGVVFILNQVLLVFFLPDIIGG